MRSKLVVLCLLIISCASSDQEVQRYEIKIENHRFIPEEIVIPSNTKISLVIHNHDNEAEEFECPSLKREKIIPKNSKVNIVISPLKKGVYDFFGDFNPSTAKGKIIVE